MTSEVGEVLAAAQRLALSRPDRKRPSPSSTAKCTRANWYGMRGVERTDVAPDLGESFVSSESGGLTEPVLAAILEERGISLIFEQTDGEGRELTEEQLERIGCAGGQVDNIGYWSEGRDDGQFLIEFKRKGTFGIKSLTMKGVLEAEPDEYTQMQLLMHALELPRAYYLAANWDKGAWTWEAFPFGKPAKWLREMGLDTRPPGIYQEWVEYNERSALAAVERAKMQHGFISSEDDSRKVPRDYEPGSTRFPCGYCPWRKRCMSDG